MVFLGYRVKRPWRPDATWDPQGTTGVVAVCSAAECLSAPPDDWEKRWDFNCVGCYGTPAEAVATVPAGEEAGFTLFAFWLVPGSGAQTAPGEPSLPPLPQAPGPTDWEHLGFDVVSMPTGAGMFPGFSHSPLSCNHLARSMRVNRWCLLDDQDEALRLAQRFNATQPSEVEPGTYFVVKVARAPR